MPYTPASLGAQKEDQQKEEQFGQEWTTVPRNCLHRDEDEEMAQRNVGVI